MNEDTLTPSPEKKPLVRRKMDFLEKNIAILSAEINKLKIRLGPILKRDEQKDFGPTEKEGEPGSEPQSLAGEIQLRADEIGRAFQRVAEIREGLEI